MKHILLLCFSLMMLFTSTAYAYPDAFWVDHSNHLIAPGHKGAIIPTGSSSLDSHSLSAAKAKSLTVNWFFASDIDAAVSPEEIGQALAGQADFFVITTCKYLPEIHEQFAALHQSYTDRRWTEVRYREYDGAMSKPDQTYTIDDWPHTEYVDIPAGSFERVPIYLCHNIYDTSGKLIATHIGLAGYENTDASFKAGQEAFFGSVLDNIINNKNDPYQEEQVSANEWAASDYSLKDKAALYIAPVSISASAISDMAAYPQIFEQAAMVQAANSLQGARVTHDSAAAVRMEMDICNYDYTYTRVEPHYELDNKEETQASSVPHDGDIFSDSLWETKHWTECRKYPGYCALDYYVAVAIKLYDRDTDRLIYSYVGSSHPQNGHTDGLYSIFHDFYSKLGKRIRG